MAVDKELPILAYVLRASLSKIIYLTHLLKYSLQQLRPPQPCTGRRNRRCLNVPRAVTAAVPCCVGQVHEAGQCRNGNCVTLQALSHIGSGIDHAEHEADAHRV